MDPGFEYCMRKAMLLKPEVEQEKFLDPDPEIEMTLLFLEDRSAHSLYKEFGCNYEQCLRIIRETTCNALPRKIKEGINIRDIRLHKDELKKRLTKTLRKNARQQNQKLQNQGF